MRQKCVKRGLVLLGKEERSKMRQNCVQKARNTFGGEHLLDDTDSRSVSSIHASGNSSLARNLAFRVPLNDAPPPLVGPNRGSWDCFWIFLWVPQGHVVMTPLKSSELLRSLEFRVYQGAR